MRILIFHLGAISACVLAILAVTRRSPFTAVFALAAALGALGLTTLAAGGHALGLAQITLQTGGVFVLLVSGLLLSHGRAAATGARWKNFTPVGLGAALFFGVALAVKFTPLTDGLLRPAPLAWRRLAGQLFAAGAPGEVFIAFVLAGLLAAGTVLGIRLATRADG